MPWTSVMSLKLPDMAVYCCHNGVGRGQRRGIGGSEGSAAARDRREGAWSAARRGDAESAGQGGIGEARGRGGLLVFVRSFVCTEDLSVRATERGSASPLSSRSRLQESAPLDSSPPQRVYAYLIWQWTGLFHCASAG